VIKKDNEGNAVFVACGMCGFAKIEGIDAMKLAIERGWTFGEVRGHEVAFCPTCSKQLVDLGVIDSKRGTR